MKLERFFEKFEQFADAPNAVAKMRELVLQLAVQGKLVAQYPDDGTATNLIEHSITQRNRLIKEKRIRNSLPITPVGEFNAAGSLPESWAWTTLAEIALINPRNYCDDDALATFIPMPGIPQKYRGPLGGEVRPWGELKKSFTHFADGDIALAKITPCFQNGKSAVLRGLKNGIGAGTTELHVARPVGDSALPEYVWIFLKSPLFIAEGIPVMAGSAGQKRVPTGYFALKPFPLPPLAEQKRIVAKVDELMALCDRLETQQQERNTRHTALARASLARFAEAPTPANLDFLFHNSYTITPADLRKSILVLAVQGKLVKQDPNDEPAKALIARIAKIRFTAKAKGYSPVDSDEFFHETPASWSWVRLGNIALTSDAGWSPQCLAEVRAGTDWGVLKVSAVSWGVFKPEENKALPPGMTARPDCEVRAGDFLLSRANTEELVARSVVVDHTPPRLMMSDKIVRFTFPDEIEKAFVNLANLSDPARAYYARNASGTSSSMKNIGREVMCNLPIPLPPLAEQRRIVAKVDQLMALVDQLETQLTASRAAAANLMEAVVAELTIVGRTAGNL